jgi:hypothetical protein
MQTTFTGLQTRDYRIAHNRLLLCSLPGILSVSPIGTNVIAEGGRS